MNLTLLIPSLGLMLLALLFSFLFSGFETGFISLNIIALEQEARKNKLKEKLLKHVREPEKLLTTTLIGNNIANIFLASLATKIAHSLSPGYFPPEYSVLVIVLIVLVFGEILPKAIFRDRADTYIPVVLPIILFFYMLFNPIVRIVSILNRKMRSMLRITADGHFHILTKEDLSFLLSQATGDALSQPQIEMIEDALDFREQEARNIMIPRTEIVAIPELASVEEILEIARKEGFTRYPVYRQNLDDITGILIIYDLLRSTRNDNATASTFALEPYFAPENTDLDVLLREMQKKRKSMAIIVDSYGGTAGLVTMEDILEEIVGDIEDEYDVEEGSKEVEQIAANTWLVEADTEIDRLCDEYGFQFEDGDFETLAGLIIDHLERIPKQGQIIHIEPYRMQILQATDKKIIKVKIHKVGVIS